MENIKVKERIDFLTEEVKKHDMLYEQNRPIITDTEYDRLYMELVDLENKYPQYAHPESPTKRIYTVIVEGLNKVSHDAPMLSQDKVTTEEGLLKFCNKANDKVLVQQKLDGLTIVLTYENGLLKMAVTRGDGYVGEDVTHTVNTIRNIPKSIEFKNKLAVRMEVIVPYAEFERINVDGKYSNPRNLASGTVRQLDASIASERNLKGIVFDLVTAEGMEFTEDLQMLEFLKSQGFDVVPYEVFENTDEGIKSLINYCLNYNNTIRKILEYMVDGLVLKFNNLAVRDKLGYTSKFPRWGCAYKFESMDATTKLRRVVWQVGKTGQYSPVAEFDTVTIDGVNINRATLHNYDNIVDKDIRIGDTIIVARANDVIPQVVQSIKELRTGEEQIIEKPQTCCECGAPIEEEGANLFCTGLNCKPQLERKLQHFVSRNAMNIDGLGSKTIVQLLENNIISNLVDIYKLEEKKDEILKLEGFGQKKYEKMIKGIEASKKNPLSRVLHGLSIRQIGESSAKDMAKEFVTMDAILESANDKVTFKERLLTVKDFGEIVSNSVVDFFSNSNNIDTIKQLQALGLEMKEEVKEVVNNENPLFGKIVVVTGTLTSWDRKGIKEFIQNHGGKVTGSVSKKTDFVLYGESAGSKLDKANELGIKTLNEDEFKELLGIL